MAGSRRRVEWSLAIALGLALVACGGDSGTVKPDQPGATLVIAVDSPLAIGELELERATDGHRVAVVLAPQRDRYQLRTVRIPVGTYRLSQVTLPGTKRKEFEFDDSPELVVEDGRLNFIGEVSFQFTDDGLRYRLRNRPARTLVSLKENGYAVDQALVFVGGKGDEWVSAVQAK